MIGPWRWCGEEAQWCQGACLGGIIHRDLGGSGDGEKVGDGGKMEEGDGGKMEEGDGGKMEEMMVTIKGKQK